MAVPGPPRWRGDAAMKRPMRSLDHVGFTVADYVCSKEFYMRGR